MMRMRKKGFTLVELLVVIAIISILAGLLLPVLEEALESSRRVSCLHQQKQLYVSAVLYAEDFDDRLPNSGDSGDGAALRAPSTSLWVRSYVGIQLHTVNSAFPDRFLSPAARGILQCPSSIWPGCMLPTNWLTSYFFDYKLPGFGGDSSWTQSPEVFTRLGKVAQPSGGFPKAMFFDSTYLERRTSPNDYFYTHRNNHGPGDPRGMNVVDGSGAGYWQSDMGVASLSYSYHATPMGMLSQFTWKEYVGGSGTKSILYYDEAGTQRLYNTGDPDGYAKAMALWY